MCVVIACVSSSCWVFSFLLLTRTYALSFTLTNTKHSQHSVLFFSLAFLTG